MVSAGKRLCGSIPMITAIGASSMLNEMNCQQRGHRYFEQNRTPFSLSSVPSETAGFPSRYVGRECGQGPEYARPVGFCEAGAEVQTLLKGPCWAVLGSAHRCAFLVGSAYDAGLTGRACRRRALCLCGARA
jgi:hypothetical protein